MSATNRIGVAPLPPGDRALMAPLAALMYAVAALLVIVSVLVLPHPPEMNREGMLALAAVGIVSAATIWLLRKKLPLLLPDCVAKGAAEVVERLRTMIPDGQHCSAGLACWDGQESPLSLIGRADDRLYAAKNAGRDQLVSV